MSVHHETRPTRYVMPEGDYKPRPTYRRPGSDHSHLRSLGVPRQRGKKS